MAGRKATKSKIEGDHALSVGLTDMPAPDGWRWVKLLDVARLESGHTPSRKHPEYWDGDVPWIGIKDAREHHGRRIAHTQQTVTEEGLANSAARWLPKDTVCLSRTASVGYVTVLDRPMATSQDFVNFVCTDEVVPEFLMRLFQAEERALKQKFSKGSTHSTIYYPEVKAFHACLPPPPLQRRIVGKVDALMAQSRRAKEALDAIPPLLERFRQSVLAGAFRGDLTADWRAQNPDVEPADQLLERIRTERRRRWEEDYLAKQRAKGKEPKNDKWKSRYKKREPVDARELPSLPHRWSWARMDELGDESSQAIFAGPFGTIFKARDFRPSGVPIIFLRHVHPWEYRTKKPGYMDVDKWEELFQPYSVYGGELLITKLGDPPGVCALFPEDAGPAMVTPDVIAMRVRKSAVDKRFLLHYLNSELARQLAFGAAYGVTRLRMNLKIFRAMPVPLPPREEQAEIIRLASGAVSTVAEQLSEVVAQRARLDELDRSVLAKAFRGDLVRSVDAGKAQSSEHPG